MARQIRFAEFVREISARQTRISYNDIASSLPDPQAKITLRSLDVYRLLKPYIGVRFLDQVKAVVPLAAYLMLFQLLILRQTVDDSWMITGGLLAVILGLMLFMEGLKIGLMPFGEVIGNRLPTKSPLFVVVLIAFLLGVGVTFAEPAIGALKTAGALVSVENAPYLYALLNQWSDVLVLVVGGGVGLAAVLGTLRFIKGWSLKPIIYGAMAPTLALTVATLFFPEIQKTVGLAWDCGAVTTGPVTVPLVLALGIGVAAAAGKGNSSLSGFGIVTLASIFPILGVLVLTFLLAQISTPEAIIESAVSSSQLVSETSWYQRTPFMEILLGFRAIVPLVLFLFFVLLIVLREKLQNSGMIFYGLTLAVLGMIVFNLGLTYGLGKLGAQAGSLVPAAFTGIPTIEDSPLYLPALGLLIAFLFAWFLGFGATMAEPALNALGITVQNLTNGAFRKSLLMYAVSIGVAFGIGIGILKIVFAIPLVYLLIPLYLIALIMTYLSTEEFVNVAWDSAGVTTGPVTVPLVLAMGLGLGDAVQALEGFGILSMASICPIISVMATGLYIQAKMRRQAV